MALISSGEEQLIQQLCQDLLFVVLKRETRLSSCIDLVYVYGFDGMKIIKLINTN